MRSGMPEPEFWLKPALVATIWAPIELFIFGKLCSMILVHLRHAVDSDLDFNWWTWNLAWPSSPSIHWIVPLIGVVLFQAASYQVMNSQFAYIANIYPKYAASLFAANAAARSGLAGGAVLFPSPMFKAMAVGPGVSVLASVMTICSALLFVLYWTGPKLRARSRFVGE